MANNIEFRTEEGEYRTRAWDFVIADDLYIFFQFGSPKSRCEIGIAYDELVDGGDWYVNEGELCGQDYEIVSDIIWNRLWSRPEFNELGNAIDLAIRKFNRV